SGDKIWWRRSESNLRAEDLMRVADVLKSNRQTLQTCIPEESIASICTRLADMHVRDLMTREVATCAKETPMVEAEKLMNRHRVRHLPVMDGSKLAGM